MNATMALLNKLLHILLGFCLASMCLLVFGNVVLRYVFNSGITWSEEMSRFLFVWMTFLGAIGALKDNEHLGMDMLVKRLPAAWKKSCYVISSVLVLIVLWLVFDGSRKLTLLNAHSAAPATGMPLSYMHAIGMVMSVCMAIIVLFNMYRALFLPASIDALVMKMESEEEIMHPSATAPYYEEKLLSGGRR